PGSALARQAGRASGVYTSALLKADKPFTHVSARWLADAPDGLQLAVRASSDGQSWTNWQTLARETHTKTASGELFGVPVSVGRASVVQLRLSLDRAHGDPVLRSAGLTLLNAKDGPPQTPAVAAPDVA